MLECACRTCKRRHALFPSNASNPISTQPGMFNISAGDGVKETGGVVHKLYEKGFSSLFDASPLLSLTGHYKLLSLGDARRCVMGASLLVSNARRSRWSVDSTASWPCCKTTRGPKLRLQISALIASARPIMAAPYPSPVGCPRGQEQETGRGPPERWFATLG